MIELNEELFNISNDLAHAYAKNSDYPWEKEIGRKAKEFERRKNMILKKISRNVHDASA